jgi:hypothetical protein
MPIVPGVLRAVLDHTISWRQMHFSPVIQNEPYLTRQYRGVVHRICGVHLRFGMAGKLDKDETRSTRSEKM